MHRMILLVLSIVFSFTLLFATDAFCRGKGGGSVSVRGYTTKSGTYVAPHQRTSPDSTKSNNWSTRGNVNPYTGKEGTKPPYK
jgi:hypothetical protein